MIWDYISAFLLIVGYIIVGRKNKWGWLISLVGNLGYVVVSFIVGLYGNMILGGVMAVVSIINFIKWSNINS